MTNRDDFHPLTRSVLDVALVDDEAALDEMVRDYVTPPVLVTESGVRFPDLPDTRVEVAGNFIESGHQMQMALIGSEPVLLVQPEFDAETNAVTLITTAVDLPPAGLIHVLEALLDGARTIVRVQEQQAAEQDAADASLRAVSEEFDRAVAEDD